MLQINGPMSLRRRIFLAASLCIFTIPAAACITGSELQVTEHNIMVQEYTGDVTQSSAVVSGTARNTGNWNIRDGRVSISFYDYKGNVLGVFSDSKAVIGPGETWNFMIELKGKSAWNVARYAIATSNK
jgi:hypothetical protein